MRTIAVTSGKGGVGKTNLSVNLAIALQSLGRRVVIVDGDIGLANLDVVLGIQPKHRLQDVVRGNVSLSQALTVGPGGVRFLGGGSGAESLLQLDGPLAEQFLNQLQALAASTDELIIDTSAGIDENVMMFLDLCDITLVVATQDPASMTDAYAVSKAALSQRPRSDIRLVVNMADNEQSALQVHRRLASVVKQFLFTDLAFAGFVRYDQGALRWIRACKPYVLADSNTPAAKDVMRLANSILGVTIISTETVVDRLRSLLIKLPKVIKAS